MKRLPLFAVSLLTAFAALLFYADHGPLYGDMRFKEFKSDRDRFERNIERARESVSEEEWQNIVDTGREALRAEWERTAEAEAERYIRAGFSEEDVEEVKRRAQDDWEREYDRAAALEKGKWYAWRENIIYEGTDLTGLKESIEAADESSTIEDWDSAVREAIEAAEKSRDMKYLPEIELLRSKGVHLTGDERAGFEEEIARIENELERYFGLEMGSMLYLSRNKFITDLFYDRDSLRAESEEESASVITDKVIQEVKDDLKKEEDAILKRSFEGEEIEGIDPSALGEEWQEELKRLVETGMKRWARAREDLYRDMVNWKGGAEESYESAEARWRKAASALEKARAEWEGKLTGEIYAGIEKWRDQESKLNENIERAQEDFQTYVDTLRSQWTEHSQGLVDMAVNGSKVYGEAVDNIKWLQEMCERYGNIGAFGKLGEVKRGNEDFENILPDDVKEFIEEKTSNLPVLWKGYYNYQYMGSEEKQDSNGNWYLEEKYTVKVYNQLNLELFPLAVGLSSFKFLLGKFEIVNTVNLESAGAEKSPYFYYKTELERWKNIKKTFGEIALDAEMTMGDNMTGNPGFLVNVNGDYELNDRANENDPYLMTTAEYEYELARRDKEFWEKRLAIAKEVYDYAYPADGKRESAEITEERKAAAEVAMNEARDRYNAALEESSGIVEELKKIQTGGEGSIEDLAERFETARNNLEKADKDYLSAKEKVIYLENETDHEYIRKEIEGIERNIAETEKRIADKRLEYMKALRNLEAASGGYEFSEIFKTADEERRAAESALNQFLSDNSEGIEDDKLEHYFTLKLEYEKAKSVTEAMTDKDFDAKSFIDSDNELNPEVYSRYAAYSVEAMKKINDAFNEFLPEEEGDTSGFTYENVKGYLESMAEGLKFIPGMDNREYIVFNTALKIFEEKYRGLTPEEWGAYKNRLDDDIKNAEAIEEFYTDEFADLNLTALIGEADNGTDHAAQKVMEYYNPGSGIAGFDEIIRYDREDEFDFKVHEFLKIHVMENYDYFYSTGAAGENENYLNGMIGRIILKTGYYDASEFEISGIEGFSIRDLTPQQMSLAVDAVNEYMQDLENRGITVPRYIEETYNTLLSSKQRLDQYLYIEDYVSDRLDGTADEIYSSAVKRAETGERINEFLILAGEIIESSALSINEKVMELLSKYGDLTDDDKKYLSENSSENVQKTWEFFTRLESANEKREIFFMVAEFMNYASGGTPEEYAAALGLDDRRSEDFLTYVKPMYIRSLYDKDYNSGSADDIEAWITEKGLSGDEAASIKIYAGIKRYREMTDAGSAPSFESLSGEVQVYLLSEKYYMEKYRSGELIDNEEELREFLENEYGEIAGDVFDSVNDYVEKLNIAAGYYGGEISEYMDNLTEEEEIFLKRFISSSGATGMPGYDAGIYGHALIIENDALFNDGEISRMIDTLHESLPETLGITGEEQSINLNDLSRAEALRSFASGACIWESWRDAVLQVEGDDFRFSSAPVDNETSIYDERNDEGLKSRIKYSNETLEKDGNVFYRSLVIEETNRLEGIFGALFESAEYETESDIVAPEAVIDAINKLKDENADYEENDLVGVFSILGLESKFLGYEDTVDGLNSEIYSMEMTLGQSGEELVEKRKVYDFLSGGDTGIDERRENLEAAREAHEAVKREYESIQALLNEAQNLYNEKNSEYIDKMNEASQLYGEFKDLEFEYEKAYSVWEYGNTPYLKGEASHDSGFNHGTMPGTDGDTTTEFAKLDVPDARDNYERIKSRYNEVLERFNEKKAAKDSQESMESLLEDEKYKELKENLIRKSEEYIRASQVNVQINEDLAKYKNDYNESKDAYVNAKESLLFYMEASEGLNNDEAAELAGVRNKILAHVKDEGDVSTYYNALGWYSCKVYLKVYRDRLNELLTDFVPDDNQREDIYDLENRIKYNKEYANKYDNLSQVIREDIAAIYNSFKVEDKSLDKIYKNFHQMAYWDGKYHYAKKRAKSKNPITKRRWKKRKKSRKSKRETYRSYYYSEYKDIKSDLSKIVETKKDFAEKSEIYRGISEVLSLEELKDYLKQSRYNLTDEDLSYLYDESNMEGFEITEESINIAVKRNEKRRKDIDEEDVYAKIINGKIAVLDKDGGVIETYDPDNPGIKLKLAGESIEEYEEGKIYELYDRSYNISEIAGLIKSIALDAREEHYAALMDYVKKSAAEGTHDYTVMLRDLEKSFNGLVKTAADFNRTTDEGEIRQRSFDGYRDVAKEYIEEIQAMVLEEMIRQNRTFQEQLWQQQREKFAERKNRWMEVTGYILNRGNRDWAVKMSEFNQQWAKWRFDARREIKAGEEWWLEQDKSMRQEMKKWNEEASNAGSKAAVENMYQDLESRVSGYEKKIRGNLPAGGNFEIDTDAILKNALSSMPEMSIGVLNSSMSAVDTTAGLSNMLNLNLNGTLFAHNEKEMAAYEQAYSVMQNMRVLDILNAILDGFNEQLKGANENLYEAVDTGIARSMPYAVAPFKRNENSREWKIKVCVASNLTGDKFKTRRFADYKNYENSTVYLKPLKGIGQEIDFTKPSSYINIDKDELDIYVGLAGESLNRDIDEVFKEGGLFTQHQESEFDRLGGRFGKYYGQWEAGEALRNAGFYSKPMFPNGPNMLQAASIAASFTGQAWVAVLVSVATSGIQVADGTMDWKQAGFQVGMSVATSALGAGASKLGDMAGAAGTFANAAAKSATMTVGNTLLSGVKLEGGKLGYDTKKITSAKTWTSAGINIAAGTITGGIKMSGMSTALVNGIAGGLSQGVTTGDWKDSMKTGLVSSVGNYLGGVLGGKITETTGMDSFAINNFVNYSMRSMLGSGEKFSWDTVAQNDSVNQMISKYVTESFMSEDQKKEQAAKEQKRREAQKKSMDNFKFANFFENTIGGFFSQLGQDMNELASDVGNAAAGVKSAWGSIKSGEAWENIKAGAATAWEGVKGAASWVKDKAVSAWNGVKNIATSVVNSVAGAVSTAVGAVQQGYTKLFGPEAIIVPPVQVAGWVHNVESKFKKGTNMNNYAAKLAGYYSTEDSPLSQERAMERLCEANGGITPAELQEKINRGEPINEPADMCWNKDVQKMYVSKPGTGSEMSHAEYMQRFREMEERKKNQDLGTDWQGRAISTLEENKEGYLKGYQKWVKGDGYNNVSMVQGDDGEYYEVRRMVNPKDGTITVVGEPTKITDENVRNQYKKEAKKPTTWCNYAANEFAQENGAPSLVYRKDLGEFGATKLGKYLENGTLNNSSGQFVEVANHMDASNLASQGNLVLMVGGGHVAAVTGGYSGKISLSNINIYQAGAQDKRTGEHLFGYTTASRGWGRKISKVKMYTWRKY